MTPLTYAKKRMQFVLMMSALGFCLTYKTDGNVQKFNKKNSCIFKKISYKFNLPLNCKFLPFNIEARIRQRKVFNEGSEFLLIK